MKISDLIPDRYEEIGSDPTAWAMNAQLLMRAARIICVQHEKSFSNNRIEPRPNGGGIIKDPWTIVDHELFRIYYLLAGLSLELLFKAIIVARDPNIAIGQVKWGCNGHDLVALAKRANVEVAPHQVSIEHLTKAIIWRGKYPVDAKGGHIYSPEGGLLNFGGTHVWAEMKPVVEETYERGRVAFREVSGATKEGDSWVWRKE